MPPGGGADFFAIIRRMPVWLGITATLTTLGLLLAFGQAVRAAVQQGDLRRKATAVQFDAAMRCNTLRGQRARDACLLQLNAILLVGATVHSQDFQSPETDRR